jgi:polar amino acid transport system ATP-binding protein
VSGPSVFGPGTPGPGGGADPGGAAAAGGPATPGGARPLLEVRHVSKSLGGKPILDDVSLSLAKGDLKVLIGPSGGGKSTLLQCVHFLSPPDSGDVILDGLSARDMSRRNICGFRREIGMIFQDFNLFDHLTARDNVAIAPRKVKGLSKEAARARALDELARVGLADQADQYPAQLSGGQKQRVSIARAMAMDPKIMLLDEPTSALDPELIGEVLNVIAGLARGGMTMLMVTHQIGFARHLTSEILFMEAGRIVECGSPQELLEGDGTSRTAQFCARLTELTGR